MKDVDSCMIICNEDHRFTVAEQLQLCGSHNQTIVLEPAGRGTAPAIAVAALLALENHDDDPELLLMPSDHAIADIDAFHAAVDKARAAAAEGYLVTFGINPESAHTGYGYICFGDQIGESEAHRIFGFTEKPDYSTALQYCRDGNYLWNAGIFLFRASSIIRELEILAPEILEMSRLAVSAGQKDLDFYRLSKEAFTRCKSTSIDYAVMEKTSNAAVIPMNAGWSDIGSWDSIWKINDKDENGNVCRGDVLLEQAENNLVLSNHRHVSVVGVEDIVVIETSDSVLVLNRQDAESVKNVVSTLRTQGRAEATEHRLVHRPWGWYDSIDDGERFKVKRIMVKPGAQLSLQKHHHRAEHWIVVKGTAMVECNNETIMLSENQSTYIPLGATHRLTNPGKIPLHMIEVQSGSYLGEDDIVRMQDNYGRTDSIPISDSSHMDGEKTDYGLTILSTVAPSSSAAVS
jgi:mannose-1-phosphate guanylyltransferase/mannose-6-phosphate isomerase